MEKIELLQKFINESNYIVFFGGAGVSTLSGIKDFRSKDGLYNMKYKYPPEMILSRSFFYKNTKEFYIFYKDKLNCLDKEPNIIHNYLYKLEKQGKLKAIITQEIRIIKPILVKKESSFVPGGFEGSEGFGFLVFI